VITVLMFGTECLNKQLSLVLRIESCLRVSSCNSLGRQFQLAGVVYWKSHPAECLVAWHWKQRSV